MSQKILITGANRGIGLGLAKYFLKNGAEVIATARKPNEAAELKALTSDYPKHCRIEALDVKSDDSVAALAAKISGLDTLINNAGALINASAPFSEIQWNDIRESFEVNTIAPMRVTKHLLAALKKSSLPKIVNMSSQMGSVADNTSGGYYGYRMSKAALNMFAKSLSVDFPKFVSVVVHPGWVKTDMGGPNAPTSVDQSTTGLGTVIDKLSARDNGKFIDFTGKEIPW